MHQDGNTVPLKFRNRFLGFTYILCIFCVGISAFGLDYTKYKAAVIPFIFLVFLDICFFFDGKKLRTASGFCMEYMKYILLIVIVTLLVYSIDTADTSLMARGFQKVFYQTLTVFGAIGAAYAFGTKAVVLTYHGLVLANTVGIARAFTETGSISQCVADFQYFLTSGFDAVGFMKYLELHEDTFAFGLLLIFFIVDDWKKHKWKILISFFFFFLGYKRIGMIGLAAAIAFYALMHKERMSLLKASGIALMLIMLIYGISYVVIVRSGLFVRLCTELNIDLMGRQNLYRYIEDYYRVSPLFMGHGFGCIEYILGHAGDIKVNNTYISRMTALHCDYLAMYIQMGMIGFLLWEICKFIDIPLFCAKYGRKCFLSALLTTLYLGITYMTDNTALYFLVCMVHFLIPAAFGMEGEKVEETKDLYHRGSSIAHGNSIICMDQEN